LETPSDSSYSFCYKIIDYGDSIYFDLSVCFGKLSGETIGDIDIDGRFDKILFSIGSFLMKGFL